MSEMANTSLERTSTAQLNRLGGAEAHTVTRSPSRGVWQATSSAPVREVILPTPTTLEALQAQVLSLSKTDRSRLLDRLVASLDVDVQAEEEWEQLAEAREAEIRAGKVAAVPLEDAMARLRARFPG